MLGKSKINEDLPLLKVTPLFLLVIIPLILAPLSYILLRSISTSTSHNLLSSSAKIQPTQTLKGHSSWVYTVAVSSQSQIFASASYDGIIKLWNLDTGSLIKTIQAHGDAVSSLAIGPDGQTLASGSWDNRIKLKRIQIT